MTTTTTAVEHGTKGGKGGWGKMAWETDGKEGKLGTAGVLIFSQGKAAQRSNSWTFGV